MGDEVYEEAVGRLREIVESPGMRTQEDMDKARAIVLALLESQGALELCDLWESIIEGAT